MSNSSNRLSLFIVTGERGVGKTTFCRHLIELAWSARWRVGGILSLPILKNGQKIAINVEDLRCGEQQRLAHWRGRPPSGSQTLGWDFDAKVLAWGNVVLQSATPCDLLIVDELGVLEFERGKGWLAGLSAVDSGDYKFGVVVVRPELLADARRRWPTAKTIDIKAVGQAHIEAERLARQMLLNGPP